MKEGQKVYLKAFEAEPRQKAIILEIGNVITVRVTPSDLYDDGLREITEDQIDNGVCNECGHPWTDRESDGLCHRENDDIADGPDGWPMASICWCDNAPDA